MTGASIQVKDDFTGTVTIEMQNSTGKFGTSSIPVTGHLFALPGYTIVQKDDELYLENA